MTRTQKTVFILVAIVALALGFTVYRTLSGTDQGDQTAFVDAGIILLPQSRAVPDLSFTDQDGQPLSLSQLKGKWTLLFFGYTFCPDICPITLAQLRQIKSELPADAVANLRIVLISVDPDRDTPQQLKQYLGYFDKQFVGLRAPGRDAAEAGECREHPLLPRGHQQAQLHRRPQRQPRPARPGRNSARFYPRAAEQPETGGAVAGAG